MTQVRHDRFEAAIDAVVSGDIQALAGLLDGEPELVQMRSEQAHQAALLHYVAANGVEDARQRTPSNITAITRLLLDAGADVNATCKAYGGSTTLDLVATSVHPERAGVQQSLLRLLLERGATVQEDIVEACLWNGRASAARFLAAHGAPLTLASGAGIGDLDLVRSYFGPDGTLRAPANFDQLQRGFLWACMYGQQPAVRFLLEHGAEISNQLNMGGTGLHWAAAGGHLSIVQLLLERGAPVEEKNRWNGTVLEQAGWAFANGDPDVDYLPVFEALLAAGAEVQHGWLEWIDGVSDRRTAEAKDRLKAVFREYGA